MKKSIFYILIILITAASCVKDRTMPASAPNVIPSGDTLVYFWNFNKADSTKRAPDFSATHSSAATFNYSSSYIDYTNGSVLNLIGTTDSGSCLRVRNPSNYIVFNMPTTGYDSIVFSFAEQSSSSGSSVNAISYTTDGVNFVTSALGNNQYNVTTTWALQSFNFSSDPAVKNNPKFAVKIQFVNNNTGSSGNDRFDNVALFGTRH